MWTFNIGIRKYVELNKVQYWLLINAKPGETSENEESLRSIQLVFSKTRNMAKTLQFIRQTYWNPFILITIILNCFTMPYLLDLHKEWITTYIVLIHIHCLLYWVDFIMALSEKVIETKKRTGLRTRSIQFLVLDGISLIPLSAVYLIVTPEVDSVTLICLRFITTLRIYRVLEFLYNVTMSPEHHWKVVVINYIIIFGLFTNFFCMYVFLKIGEFSRIKIKDWDTSDAARQAVSVYFSLQTVLAVALGDILPVTTVQRLVCIVVTVAGCSQVGIITGILTTAFTNRDKQREYYRYDYESTMKVLKERKIDKKILDKISDNMMTIWTYKKGFTGAIIFHILPTALQAEFCFDINFGLLNRSLIFSTQPRSFLRSVSLFMKTLLYLPGDIIMEPFGTTDAMLCVASGVIEVVSEENDETVLFSLTSGTIIGEATLFLSIPIRCIIRAATYVELQVLMKVHFSRLALKYPDIIRSMRSEIYYRLRFRDYADYDNVSILDTEFQELLRRKETKKFIQELRKKKDKNAEVKKFRVNAYKSAILSLYVLSENIPQVKTLPVTLLRARPWILRPDTTVTKLWSIFIALLAVFVAFIYPIYAAFERTISPAMNVFMVFTEVAYIIDLFMECTTAIQRNDKFTFITSVKEIVTYKLKTFGFYLDILATYDISVYSELRYFDDKDYAALVLSLNRVLKIWRAFVYFRKMEDHMKSILILVRTAKYFFYFAVAVTWGAAIMYLEACPEEVCNEDRWFSQLEAKEVSNMDVTPCTRWPATTSFYFSAGTICGVAVGDIYPTTPLGCILTSLLLCVGVIILAICMTQTSSSFRHIARVRRNYQSEVFAVDRFMSEHEMPKHLRLEVKNYLQLQWNYDKGYSLMNNGTTEGLPPQQRHIVIGELMKPFLTVPMFREAGTEFLKALARSSKVRLLPPNVTISEAGSFDREMFILENGYCEASMGKEKKVIGPVNPFGFYEMIVGIPLGIRVRSLTHVRIITLNYASYLRAITKYPSVKIQIDDMIEKNYNREQPEKAFKTFGYKPLEDIEPRGEKILKQQELLSKQFINAQKYTSSLSLNYWQPFKAWGKLRFFQFFFFPFVIAPNSLFIKIWSALRIINVLLIGIVAPIYFSLPKYMDHLFYLIISLQVFTGVDMYLMFHVSYYDSRGLLMFHPAKTAVEYLKGNFIIDLLTTFPHYWVVKKAFPPSNNSPSLLYDGLGLIFVLQFYKFIQGCYHLESDILRDSATLKILKFVPLAIIITNLVTGIMVLLECYNFEHFTKSSELGNSKLAEEWKESLNIFCSPDQSHNTTKDVPKLILKMYLITLYWVSQSMTGCGFGDITAHDSTTMIATIIIMALGIFLYGYMFADLTSGMITAYVVITKYRRRIREMSIYVKEKNINPILHKRLVLHYDYNWQRTEGSKPQKIFTCFHAALRQSIMASIYEATVKAVPGFEDVEKPIIRIIGQYLDEMYFLQGETIVNYNDVQDYIYLLYRGKVEVLSKEGMHITIMGRGGLFGNVSNTPFSLSSVAVVATTNVDVLRLDCNTFFKAMKISPNTKQLMQYLSSEKKDYIEPRSNIPTVDVTFSETGTIPYEITLGYSKIGAYNKKELKPSITMQYLLLMIKMAALFKYATTMRAVRPSMYYSDPTLTTAQSSFHFKNSVFKAVGKHIYTFVILPETGLYNTIEILVIFLAYLSTTLTLYAFAFQEMSLIMLSISYSLDFLFLLKIGLQYHFSYFDKFGDYVVDLRMIRKRYHHSRTLIYDMLSNLPLDLIALTVPPSWKLQALSILRLNRIIRLGFILDFHKVKLQSLMVNKIYLEFWWILICTTLTIHFFTCLWFSVVCPLGHCYYPCFVSEMDLIGKGNFELYVVSMYYIIAIMTTAGFSGIPIYSTREIVLSVILIISCRFAVVLLIGILTAALNAQNEHLSMYQERISELKKYFVQQNLSEYQLKKMWNYVKSLWFFKSGLQIPKFITTAPYAMKCEVMSEMFGSHLSQSYIFSELEPPFLRQLALYLCRSVYFPGNYIIQQGDIDHTMYFIHKGKVSVLTIHPDLMETIHFTLTENDTFGMMQGLVVGAAHPFSYRALTDVVVLSLTLHHWKRLLKHFPKAEQEIYKKLQAISSDNDILT